MKLSLSFLAGKRLPLACFLVFYLLFAAFHHKDYGVTWDEYIVYMGGYWLYQDMCGHPQPILRKDSQAPGSPHYDYLYPMLLYALHQKRTIPGFHFSNMIFAGSILVAGYESVLPFCVNPWWALLGPLFLVLNPRFFGQWANNPMDMPFAVFYFVSLCLIYRWRESGKLKHLLLLGLSISAASCVRLLGLSLLILYLLFEMYEKLSRKEGRDHWRRWIFSLAGRFVFLMGVVFVVFWLTWPFWRENPWIHGLRLIHLARNFPWNMPVLFEGLEIPGTQLGRSYLFVWFLISTPIFILGMALAGTWILCWKNPHSFGSFLGMVLVFHLLLYGVLKPNIYDGVRHYLFLEPILSILACLFFIDWIKEKSWIKWVGVILVSLNMCLVSWNMVELHPYEYVYFNEFVGGLKGAANRFETEYAGASYKEAVEWLENNRIKDPHRLYRVNTEGSAFQSAHYFWPNMQWAYFRDADYFIANTRWNQQMQANPRQIIHVVEREGVPLSYVFRLR